MNTDLPARAFLMSQTRLGRCTSTSSQAHKSSSAATAATAANGTSPSNDEVPEPPRLTDASTSRLAATAEHRGDIMGRHDDTPKGRADNLDAQSLAFRNATEVARVSDDELRQHTAVVHPPLYSGQATKPLELPEDYEAKDWDAERIGPKSLAEARQALAERIADPVAPDGPEVEVAYDGLDD